MALVTSVMRVHQILLARVHAALTPFSLTFARYEVLMLLQFSRTGSMPLGKIGQRLQVHPASVTNVVDRLEADGVGAPHPAPERPAHHPRHRHRRRTPGAALATTAINAQVFERTDLSGEALRTLFTTMADLRRAAGDFTSTPAPPSSVAAHGTCPSEASDAPPRHPPPPPPRH
jgi:hypothetical protein